MDIGKTFNFNIKSKTRLYFVPVRELCNASCTFCYMKEKIPGFKKPPFINFEIVKSVKNKLGKTFQEVEITGGGDPTIHKDIDKIIKLFDEYYIKMYTNGFILRPLQGLDELNISRVHWNSNINNHFYNSKMQNDLNDTINYYRPMVKKIRMQIILIKGAIDNEQKALEFIKKFEDRVDVFMFRTLFPKCKLDKENFVAYFQINHPKAVLDNTLDNYDRDLFFVGTDGVIHNDFQF